jgi:hypothetical protein
MTVETLSVHAGARSGRRATGTLLALGWTEARRMLTSPAYAVLLVFILLSSGAAAFTGDVSTWLPTKPEAYDLLRYLLVMYAGLATYLVAHLVSSSARRNGAEAQLSAAPAGERARTLGLVMGLVMGPVAVAAILLAVVAWLGGEPEVVAAGLHRFSSAQLVQIALMVLGGGVFGVMIATWLRFPGSLLLGLFALVFATGWLGGDSAAYAAWLPLLVPFVTAPDWFDAVVLTSALHVWHAVYLLGLCGLGTVAAALHDPGRRLRWVGYGAVVLVVTVAAAVAQS